mgnify:CR=1 FL=1
MAQTPPQSKTQNPVNVGLADSQKRQAEATIKKGTSGPYDKLLQNPFDFDILRFPENVGNAQQHVHYIKFTPCIQQKSEYSVKTTGQSQADINRAGGTSLAGSEKPFSAGAATGIAAGLGVLGVGEAAVEAGEAYFKADSVNDKLQAVKDFKSDAAKAGFGAVASGLIVSQINLSRKTRRAAASICLYMPDTVNQTQVNDYDQVSLTAALGKAGLVGQAGGAIMSGVGKMIEERSLKSFGLGGGGTAMGGVAELGGMLAEKTGNFGEGITDVLLFSAGIAQNPQVELLFKSIQNREFLFDFKFVPRSRQEAETIKKIIKAFRFHAAPEIPTASSGRYFIPPSEFDIEFMVGQQSNPNLPKISTCVLQGIDVNYGSAGQWTAFEGGMPVEISMQLRFKEVEIMHKKLIADGY